MFNIEKLHKKQEMIDGGYHCYHQKEVVFIKEKLIINKKNENYNIILDTLNLLKSMDHHQSDMINFKINEEEIVIKLKYKDNIKNDKFINALKDFLKKYKKKTFSKSILSV
tara:strand:+ start:5182 stop:5514 length:333 start_codon:yes stop_codon:yes gene_type:complete